VWSPARGERFRIIERGGGTPESGESGLVLSESEVSAWPMLLASSLASFFLSHHVGVKGAFRVWGRIWRLSRFE